MAPNDTERSSDNNIIITVSIEYMFLIRTGFLNAHTSYLLSH